ncbi:SigE family RNA polymerase sigma factor [Amorphoplanes digitatis]|uniref:RNA polymerase sigma-70 factor (Sigma-E family) n=1 Tax=Actinoplanes digitatis TaxID=1868 RepID=A0A7W7I3E7_9ACTN|nr:SigE family RNA polymerase sigma factor [Actinoplanes digitatis]MBB4765662.1 RNA polymerase sigma-70 factor (sigma-E family) [Actinoplanes digitatis]BFE75537.1 SigE family RNA polymerase sigma factor [Actinoplanes digitatis]GID98323.1 RNA polymerase sigma factor [Actinoplanes digitatis]
MDKGLEEAFQGFVAARSGALLRTAYLLVGDRHGAEDLLQTALVKTFVRFGAIRDTGALEGYVRRTMATTATSWWRGRPFRERPVERIPDRPCDAGPDAGPGAGIEQDAMWSHLRALPAKQRAVLVLRYYEGLAEAEIAEVLGISRGTVKSHASRGLATLRQRLGEERDVAEAVTS